MPIFILPTKGPATYRGKYPTRARSIGDAAMGRLVELNDGTRLWAFNYIAADWCNGRLNSDFGSCLARAVPMTESQYAELMRAAELLKGRAQIAGHGRRAELEARVREIVSAIPDMVEPAAKPAPQPAADDRETVRINLRRQAAGMAAIADSENAPTQALKVALARPDATRRDNVEYYAGREAFQRGEPESACPYYARDKFGDNCRHARWTLGWREARDNVPGPDAADVIGEAGTRAGIRTVDATPAWAGILPLLRAAVENGTPKGRAMAWAEIERMAALADERNAMAPALFTLATSANETRHCVPGMAGEELESAISGAWAALGTESGK